MWRKNHSCKNEIQHLTRYNYIMNALADDYSFNHHLYF